MHILDILEIYFLVNEIQKEFTPLLGLQTT